MSDSPAAGRPRLRTVGYGIAGAVLLLGGAATVTAGGPAALYRTFFVPAEDNAPLRLPKHKGPSVVIQQLQAADEARARVPIKAPPIPTESAADRRLLDAALARAANWSRETQKGAFAPVPGGEGLLVCEPASSTADAALLQFGAACARWLQLNVGGEPELSKTPTWGSVEDARQSLGLPSLRLNPAEAARLQPFLGITRAATGTIDGNAAHCMLSFRLCTIPGLRTFGEPVSLDGSQEAISQGLPALKRRLCRLLHIEPQAATEVMAVKPADMLLLGRLPPKLAEKTPPLEPADVHQLKKLALQCSLAGVLLLRSNAVKEGARAPFLERLLQQGRGNAMVAAEVARAAPMSFRTQLHELLAGAAAHRSSYLANYALMQYYRQQEQRSDEFTAAVQAARCAPDNPLAWIDFGEAVENRADEIRRGRYITQLSPNELSFIDRYYPWFLMAELQAARLAPHEAYAWRKVSSAAAFNGNMDLADAAFWRALRLDPHDTETYSWGLQFFQPKWLNQPAKMAALAAMIAADDALLDELHQDTMWSLAASNLLPQANELLSRTLTLYRMAERRNPRDPRPHLNMAYLARNNGIKGSQDQTATREFRQYLELRPDDETVHFDLAYMLHYKLHLYADAEKEYRLALGIDPNYAAVYTCLGDIAYFSKHDAAHAEQLYRRAIALEANGFYHAELAALLVDGKRQAEARREANLAIALGYREPHRAFTALGIDPEGTQSPLLPTQPGQPAPHIPQPRGKRLPQA